jgi:hypothetical protein
MNVNYKLLLPLVFPDLRLVVAMIIGGPGMPAKELI